MKEHGGEGGSVCMWAHMSGVAGATTIALPSLHLVGKWDWLRARSLKLTKLFETPECVQTSVRACAAYCWKALAEAVISSTGTSTAVQ